MSQLDAIQKPADLSRLDRDGLEALAAELRTCIIETVSCTGGHLAPNLGVVELTMALLRVFDPESDRIVWDTSHQTYAWKLLTGRRAAFSTLRQYNGLSGFSKPSESPCDAFGAGHAGTALSVALGMAAARDRLADDRQVVAVVGDAAIGNGMSLEALNNLAGTARRLIVVLNDNEMSIGNNVGSLALYFGKLLANPKYNRIKTAVERLGLRLRMRSLREPYHRLEEALKSLVLENAVFEAFGLRYIGPIDGHDVLGLEAALRVAREYDRPVLLHVNTRKGLGYEPAELAPEKWHGTCKFDIETAARGTAGRPTWSEVFGRTLITRAETDKRICAITAGMCAGTGLDAFAERFPDRFFDVGICEAHAVTFAAGLAAAGLRPVVALYSSFLQRAVDGVFHDLCLQHVPVLLGIDRAGLVGDDGPTHHGMFDIPMLRCIPDLVQLQPASVGELEAMVTDGLAWERPVAIRYPRGAARETMVSPPAIVLGRAEVVSSPEAAVVQLWGLGDEVETLREVAGLLNVSGITAGLVSARFVKPLDHALLVQQARQGARLMVTLENGSVTGGFGSAVQAALSTVGITVPTLVLGWPDCFIAQGAPERLRADHGLTAPQIAETIRERLRAAGSTGER